MTTLPDNLPVLAFETAELLRDWLQVHHATSKGIWLRIYKKGSNIRSVSFEQVLDEGLCFGWSESSRRAYDRVSYLQKFTPRRVKRTTSERNRRRAKALTKAGRMTEAGLEALGLAAKPRRPAARLHAVVGRQ